MTDERIHTPRAETLEHPLRVIKRQVGLVKVRFRGLQKNAANVLTLFALPICGCSAGC